MKSSNRPRTAPKSRPEFVILGRSNGGKSSLVNALVRKKEIALMSKKSGEGFGYGLMHTRCLFKVPNEYVCLLTWCLVNVGKTQLINHFLTNKS